MKKSIFALGIIGLVSYQLVACAPPSGKKKQNIRGAEKKGTVDPRATKPGDKDTKPGKEDATLETGGVWFVDKDKKIEVCIQVSDEFKAVHADAKTYEEIVKDSYKAWGDYLTSVGYYDKDRNKKASVDVNIQEKCGENTNLAVNFGVKPEDHDKIVKEDKLTEQQAQVYAALLKQSKVKEDSTQPMIGNNADDEIKLEDGERLTETGVIYIQNPGKFKNAEKKEIDVDFKDEKMLASVVVSAIAQTMSIPAIEGTVTDADLINKLVAKKLELNENAIDGSASVVSCMTCEESHKLEKEVKGDAIVKLLGEPVKKELATADIKDAKFTKVDTKTVSKEAADKKSTDYTMTMVLSNDDGKDKITYTIVYNSNQLGDNKTAKILKSNADKNGIEHISAKISGTTKPETGDGKPATLLSNKGGSALQLIEEGTTDKVVLKAKRTSVKK